MTTTTTRPYDFFVTGTDTEIGKTLVSSALLQALTHAGLSNIRMKPIASGAEWRDGAWHNDDVDSLRDAASVKVAQELVCPYLMQTPAAPHIVAQQENIKLEFAPILDAYHGLQAQAEAIIIEGVGGFCVPLDDQRDTADLAQTLGLPVILAVGIRLGCINHALLTAAAIRARGLRLVGWVANCVSPDMLYPAENIAALEQRLDAPLLGRIPYLTQPAAQRPAAAAAWLDLSPLGIAPLARATN